MTPFYRRLPDVSAAGLDLSADQIGLGIVGATFVGASAHGVAKVLQQRRYFAEHPERRTAVGNAPATDTPATDTPATDTPGAAESTGTDPDTATDGQEGSR
jgi:hydrogenase small subunit